MTIPSRKTNHHPTTKIQSEAVVNENKDNRDFSSIPASACTFVIGEFTLGDNGEGAKSAPVKLVARTGKPIEHWYWGRVVHDMAGMRVHKPRLPIDYVHDSKEVIGYLNKFETESGDLVTSGALVPFKDTDRATEIVHKWRAGVPYEASINFGGDGIKVEEIPEGYVSQVNGFSFEGPGIVIREWPLRGVAICPYGADMNTSTNVFANNGKVFTAAVVTAPEATTKDAETGDKAMSKQSVEVAAQVETPVAEVKNEAKPVEVKPAEAKQMAAPPVAAPAVEAKAAEGDAKVTEQKKELSRDEVTKIADEFGAEIAVEVVRKGGDYNAALRLAYDKAVAEVKQLRESVAALGKVGTGSPAPVTPLKETKGGLFKTGK